MNAAVAVPAALAAPIHPSAAVGLKALIVHASPFLGAGAVLLGTYLAKDVLGNIVQGINFLVTRPYGVGDRIQIENAVGTVADLTLNGIRAATDDGGQIKARYDTLSAKPVIIIGDYRPHAFRSVRMVRPSSLRGGLRAAWGSLDRGFILSAILLGGLVLSPWLAGAMAAGWAGPLFTYAVAGAAAWFTRNVERVLVNAVETLADLNSWRLESRVLVRLAVRAGVWAVGGGAIPISLGVTWTALAASLGVTTLGVGIASNNFISTVVQGGEILFAKPFKVGDRLTVGLFEGVVEDMTLYHVVVKLDEGRHVLLPYAVLHAAAFVVHPGNKHP